MSVSGVAPSEATPLRSNQAQPTGSDQVPYQQPQSVIVHAGSNSTGSNNSNSGASNPNSEVPIIKSGTMDDTKRILIRVGIDFLILCCGKFAMQF